MLIDNPRSFVDIRHEGVIVALINHTQQKVILWRVRIEYKPVYSKVYNEAGNYEKQLERWDTVEYFLGAYSGCYENYKNNRPTDLIMGVR